MGKRALLIVLLTAALVIAISPTVMAALNIVFYGTGWQTAVLSQARYSSINHDGGVPYTVYATGTEKGLDRVYFSLVTYQWTVDKIDTTTKYIAVASDASASLANGNVVYAALADGGIDKYYLAPGSSTWEKEAVNTSAVVYTRLTQDASAPDVVYGLRTDKKIDRIFRSGDAWAVEPVDSVNTYATIVNDYALGNTMYGALSTSGMNWMYNLNDGSGWVTEPVASGASYTALTCDNAVGTVCYGARPEGGIDRVYWNGAAWATEALALSDVPVTQKYSALAYDGLKGSSFKIIYAARADKGIDRYYDLGDGSGWHTDAPNTTDTYMAITADAQAANFCYGICPDPPAMTPGQASALPVGAVCNVTAYVSAMFDDSFFLETSDRTSAIRVYWAPTGLSLGQQVQVLGPTGEFASGERVVVSPTIIPLSGSATIEPLALNNKALGGGATGSGQPAITDAAGLNNIALLIRTTGATSNLNAADKTFTLDDGSGVVVKVKAVGSGITLPNDGSYVIVTGVVSCDKDADTGVVSRVIEATAVDNIMPAL